MLQVDKQRVSRGGAVGLEIPLTYTDMISYIATSVKSHKATS